MNLEKIRLGLALALAFTALLLMNAWQAEQRRMAVTEPATETAIADQTTLPSPPMADPATAPARPAVSTEAARPATSQVLTLRSTLLEVGIGTLGGEVEEVHLLDYPQTLAPGSPPVHLMTAAPDRRYHFQSGWMNTEHVIGPDTLFRVSRPPSEDVKGTVSLELSTTTPEGIEFSKRFSITAGSYVVRVEWTVRNGGTSVRTLRPWSQIQRHWTDAHAQGDTYTYTGAAWSTPEDRYSRKTFEDMRTAPLEVKATDGWVAMLQHYFVSAVIPPAGEPWLLYSRAASGDRYIIGASGPQIELAPDAAATRQIQYFVGPKLQDVLEAVAPGLDLTVDYGALWIFAKPLWWLMSALHTLTGNWGWAIVLLTVSVKVAFYRLSAASYRSMAHLRRVQPKVQALRERYKDDPAQMQKAMMDIYREEKINPLGGCLPLLVQAPVFFSLYWVLLESVELRQAPWILWIEDLSAPDPWFILPVVMGATMILQTRLNPPAPDPMQQRMMEIMPIVFTGFTAFFASGLVLYWLVNNVLSIGQQWLITRSIEAEPQPAKG
jgi:YidC/Oxa1 family membrane protein insertase